ncbi:hypothetical protein BVC80_9093g109 [Macleaya cordata]|uniref:LOB domain-containing protein n=1 Tax=Macleaya cordata TaxID=56857 RepID=A0A200PX45_MACCD|nr:hypothetical protein BVC80_9093g109 [Macleaya cordata]
MMKGQEYSRPTASCAACKFLKRKCIPSCVFAPYFRADELQKFAKVHKVFGASNVSKIISEVPVEQREDAVKSLVYEAEARLRDPVYGCIGALALLHSQMLQLQHDLAISRARLASLTSNPSPPPPPSSSPPPPSPLIYNNYYVDGFIGLPSSDCVYEGMSSDQSSTSSCPNSFEWQLYGSPYGPLPTSFPQ